MTRWLAWLGPTVLLGGCGGIPFPIHDVIENPTAEQATMTTQLIGAVFRAPAVQMQCAALLGRGGDELDFALVAQTTPPHELAAAGLTDVGGTLFEAVKRDAGIELLSNHPMLPDRLVTDGLLADLVIVLLPPEQWQLARVGTGYALLGNAHDHDILLFASRVNGPIDRIVAGRDGRLLREITIEDWTAEDRSRRPLRVHVDNIAGGYELRIHIAEWFELEGQT